METIEMRVPDIGESTTEVTLSRWLVANGEFVNLDSLICEFETDKVTLEFPVEASGILIHIASEGDDLEIGALFARIETQFQSKEEYLTRGHIEKKENSKMISDLNEIILEQKEIICSLEAKIKEYFDQKEEYLTREHIEKKKNSKMISDLNEIILEQKKIIDSLGTENLNQKEDISSLYEELEKNLGVKIKDIPLNKISDEIISHFQKIESFDKYLEEKSKWLENWLEMLAEGKIEQAIKEIKEYVKEKKYKDLFSEITQISSNWYTLKQKENSNIINHEYADQQKSKLNYALIQLINELEKNRI